MKDIFKKNGIQISEEAIAKLEIYYDLMIKWNNKINLTSIVERDQVIEKHFLDSALIMKDELWSSAFCSKIMDVGTGAGFPGMVLAILNPDKEFHLLDSLKKRVDFLEEMKQTLSLDNVQCFHGRAEIYGQDQEFRNRYDIVVSRAVADLPVLIEYCIPFVREGGYFVSYKGKKAEDELEYSKRALEELSAVYDHADKYKLDNGENRSLLYIKNEGKTNQKYPRRDGKPRKSPLV